MAADFIINVAASLAFVLLGYSLSRIQHWFLHFSFRSIWKPFLKDKHALVVLSTRPGPYPRSTPRVSLVEMQAYIEISKLSGRLGINMVPVSSETSMDEIRSNNIILLGSSLANAVTAKMWRTVSDKLPFVFHVDKQYLSIGDREFIPVEDEDGQLVTDYGLIIRQVHPFNSEKALVLAMGCHGFSTYGSMRMMTEIENARRLLKATANKDFIALIEVRLQDKRLISSRIVECYILPQL